MNESPAATVSTSGVGWLPIADAPKDGTDIDVWVREFTIGDAGAVSVRDVGRIPNACWSIERHYYLHGEPHIGSEERWVVNERGGNYEAIEIDGRRITHWMPLPAPPATA